MFQNRNRASIMRILSKSKVCDVETNDQSEGVRDDGIFHCWPPIFLFGPHYPPHPTARITDRKREAGNNGS